MRWRRLVFKEASQMRIITMLWFLGHGRGPVLVGDFIAAAKIVVVTTRAGDSFRSYG